MGYTNAQFGVLIFSRGNESLWDDLTTIDENTLSLTTLIPSPTGIRGSTNNTNLEKLAQRISNHFCMAKEYN